jgi:hypothetical protein
MPSDNELKPRDVATRMRAIEDNVSGETGEDNPPLDRVVASLLNIEYEGLDIVLADEASRVLDLHRLWYSRFGVKATPQDIASLGIIQGITFAVAASRLQSDK